MHPLQTDMGRPRCRRGWERGVPAGAAPSPPPPAAASPQGSPRRDPPAEDQTPAAKELILSGKDILPCPQKAPATEPSACHTWGGTDTPKAGGKGGAGSYQTFIAEAIAPCAAGSGCRWERGLPGFTPEFSPHKFRPRRTPTSGKNSLWRLARRQRAGTNPARTAGAWGQLGDGDSHGASSPAWTHRRGVVRPGRPSALGARAHPQQGSQLELTPAPGGNRVLYSLLRESPMFQAQINQITRGA